jgi:hypothetical protein
MASMASSIPAEQPDHRVVFGGIDTTKTPTLLRWWMVPGCCWARQCFRPPRWGIGSCWVGWVSAGTLARVGVEGTGSYGAGSAASYPPPVWRWWR